MELKAQVYWPTTDQKVRGSNPCGRTSTASAGDLTPNSLSLATEATSLHGVNVQSFSDAVIVRFNYQLEHQINFILVFWQSCYIYM